eukprot:TRINITY_DN1117_c0_g1_i10.p2 TRINITY_DN1117_c0_g1~~TRINITY_DN1117_c0_g1_i10.p2  ORF type:complete len:125 (+),score=32.58 TRINITY_DN1117_c0_g1_i10:98-472(+)
MCIRDRGIDDLKRIEKELGIQMDLVGDEIPLIKKRLNNGEQALIVGYGEVLYYAFGATVYGVAAIDVRGVSTFLADEDVGVAFFLKKIDKPNLLEQYTHASSLSITADSYWTFINEGLKVGMLT